MDDKYWGFAKGIVDKMLILIGDNKTEIGIIITLADRTLTWKEGKPYVSSSYKSFTPKRIRKHRTMGLNVSERNYYKSLKSLVDRHIICRTEIEGEQVMYLNVPHIVAKYILEVTEEADLINSEYYKHCYNIQREFHRFYLDRNLPIFIPNIWEGKGMKVIDAMQRPTPPKTEKRREKHKNRQGKPYNVHEAIKKINECFWKWDIVMYPDFHDDDPELNGLRYQEIASVRKFIEMFPHPDAFDNFWETAADNWDKVHQMLRATQRYNFDYTGVDITALAYFRKEIKEYVDNDFAPSYEYDLPLYEMEEGDDLFEYDIQCSEEDISLGQAYYH